MSHLVTLFRPASWCLLLVLALSACAISANQPTPIRGDDVALRDVEARTRQFLVTVPRDQAEQMAAIEATLPGDFGVRRIAEWPLAAIDVFCVVLQAVDEEAAIAAMAQLTADQRVLIVQPMNTFEVMGTQLAVADTKAPQAEENLETLQHGLQAIDALNAHNWATGKGVRIAVVDTGIDTEHQDLKAAVTDNRNLVSIRREPARAEFHGTAIAGGIAAASGDGAGITGVAPQADLIGLRACWQLSNQGSGVCNSFTLARALNFAIQNQVDIINMSLTGPIDPLLASLVDQALSDGIIVVAAFEKDQPGESFPATHRGVIPAGPAMANASLYQTRLYQTRGEGDWWGPLPAPSDQILTTAPNGDYRFLSGSSLATAHMSGVVALMLELDPMIDADTVYHALQASVGNMAGVDEAVGVIDACRSIANLAKAACN